MAKKAKSSKKKKRATKNLNVSASAVKRVMGGQIKYIK